MFTLKGKVALVTGASRGIGKAIAVKLAENGVNLAINSSSAGNLEAVKKELMDKGVDVLLCPADLADPDMPGKIIQSVTKHFGKLDILINNAGVGSSQKPLEETLTKEWDLIMAVNTRAPFLLCREALPYLKKSDSATIINITSTLATRGYVNSSAYTASKHALRGMTKVLAQEVFKDNIRVHVIAPGGVASDMLSKSNPDWDSSMLSTPEDMADIAIFLLTHRGGGMVIDEIRSHRFSKNPWQ